MTKSQPAYNVLFVFSDQHRWCDLGCYGNAEVLTPHLDALAEDGLKFTHCLSNSPVCVPARGSLLTGRYPLAHGAVTNDLPVRKDCRSVADLLNGAGYHTGYIGKWHLGGVPRDQAISPEGRLGFREWKVCNCDHNYMDSYYYDEDGARHGIDGYDAQTYTELAMDFIRRNAASPWGLWLSWGPPHDPYFAVPQRYLELYKGRSLSLRPNVPEKIIDRKDSPAWSPERVRECLAGYYAQITALDEQFARLLAALRETGQYDNTLIVYTSDHGDMLGSQGWTNKQLPYDESVRVPLIARLPGVVRTGTCEELLGLVDLPVSLAGLLGCPLERADGKDRQDLFRDPGACAEEASYIFDLVPCHQSIDRGTDAWRGVRTARHTYACYPDGTPWLLFDNQLDPFQQENLIALPEHSQLRAELHARVEGYARRYDALLTWEDLIRHFGLSEAWNHSQRYFQRPELTTGQKNELERQL